jgi:hypothetical protein
MNYLTIGDLYLALNDLLDKRHAGLIQSKIGQGYEPLLQKKRTQLNALPKSVTSLTPLTEQLGEQDVIHDSCIDTFLQVTGAVFSSPRASSALKKAAKDIIDTLKIAASDKGVTYPQEAFIAVQRKDKIEALKGTLHLFALPEGGTLYDIALDYVAAGETINQLLSERGKVDGLSDEEKRAISTLRPEIIGILGRLRKALPDELAGDASLPENLVAALFGYFDDLQQTRVTANQNAQETKQRAKEAASNQAAKDAKLEAATAQVAADLLAKEAEVAQKKADEAKKKANEKA